MIHKGGVDVRKNQDSYYEKMEKSPSFKRLMKEKKGFLVPSIIFFMMFYFSLPILAVYTDVLNGQVYGDITWAWVLAIAQFIMTWTLCTLYVRKAAKFDKLAEEVIEESERKERASL